MGQIIKMKCYNKESQLIIFHVKQNKKEIPLKRRTDTQRDSQTSNVKVILHC